MQYISKPVHTIKSGELGVVTLEEKNAGYPVPYCTIHYTLLINGRILLGVSIFC